jgi:hypothetical protein
VLCCPQGVTRKALGDACWSVSGLRDENGLMYTPSIVRVGLNAHHSVQSVTMDNLVSAYTFVWPPNSFFMLVSADFMSFWSRSNWVIHYRRLFCDRTLYPWIIILGLGCRWHKGWVVWRDQLSQQVHGQVQAWSVTVCGLQFLMRLPLWVTDALFLSLLLTLISGSSISILKLFR